jgi:hypothetical protein
VGYLRDYLLEKTGKTHVDQIPLCGRGKSWANRLVTPEIKLLFGFRCFLKDPPLPARICRMKLDSLHTRREFFTSFWSPMFDKARELGLTDAEAEHTTERILESFFRDGELDESRPLDQLVLRLIQVSAYLQLKYRRPKVGRKDPATSDFVQSVDYYSLPLIEQRLLQALQRFLNGSGSWGRDNEVARSVPAYRTDGDSMKATTGKWSE